MANNKPPIPFFAARKVVQKLFHKVTDVTVEGSENIPEEGPYVVICNHLNWSDPFYLYTILPPEPKMIFVAEFDGIYDKWWNKGFIDFMGKPILPIDRSDPRSRIKTAKSMMKVLKDGNVLAIFPEGRLGHKEGDLFPFHVGAFGIARKLKVPVLPIAMAGTRKLSYKKPIHFKIGKPTTCRSDESTEDFARRMALTVKELMPEYPGDGPSPYRLNWMTGLCQGELRPFEGERDLIINNKRKDKKRA